MRRDRVSCDSKLVEASFTIVLNQFAAGYPANSVLNGIGLEIPALHLGPSILLPWEMQHRSDSGCILDSLPTFRLVAIEVIDPRPSVAFRLVFCEPALLN